MSQTSFSTKRGFDSEGHAWTEITFLYNSRYYLTRVNYHMPEREVEAETERFLRRRAFDVR